jgi:hypothetical protein
MGRNGHGNGNGHDAGGEFAHVRAYLARRWPQLDTSDASACWNYPGRLHPSGYARIGAGGECVTATRFVWALSRGVLELHRRVWHLCGRQACLNPAHLVDHHPRGLAPAAVRLIRQLHAEGVSKARLARRFRRTGATIRAAVAGRGAA